jgi:hypothetical protein
MIKSEHGKIEITENKQVIFADLACLLAVIKEHFGDEFIQDAMKEANDMNLGADKDPHGKIDDFMKILPPSLITKFFNEFMQREDCKNCKYTDVCRAYKAKQKVDRGELEGYAILEFLEDKDDDDDSDDSVDKFNSMFGDLFN